MGNEIFLTDIAQSKGKELTANITFSGSNLVLTALSFAAMFYLVRKARGSIRGAKFVAQGLEGLYPFVDKVANDGLWI